MTPLKFLKVHLKFFPYTVRVSLVGNNTCIHTISFITWCPTKSVSFHRTDRPTYIHNDTQTGVSLHPYTHIHTKTFVVGWGHTLTELFSKKLINDTTWQNRQRKPTTSYPGIEGSSSSAYNDDVFELYVLKKSFGSNHGLFFQLVHIQLLNSSLQRHLTCFTNERLDISPVLE